MSQEDLTREEEANPKPADGSELEDIAEDIFDDEEVDKDDKISSLEKEVADLKKGMAKAFSDKGREKKTGQKATSNDSMPKVLKSLYFNSNPEAELIWNQVEEEAERLQKDPFELYESSSYFKGEAKAKAAEQKEKDKSQSLISKPSTQPASQKDISKVKPEDVASLSRADKVKWLDAQAEKERGRIE